MYRIWPVPFLCLTLACGGGGGGTPAPPSAPVLTTLSPTTAGAGGQAFTLTVTGNNFCQESSVLWNGSPRPTTFQAPTRLTATIAADDISNPGTISVTVSNPSSEGGPSNEGSFPVTASLPTLSSYSPLSVASGGSSFTLQVGGKPFYPDSRILWNGSPRPTTYISSTRLQATIPAEDIATPGTAQVTVSNPANEGGDSAAFPLVISNVQASALDLPANDIAWDPVHGRIYASLPGSAGTNASSIVAIDPDSGTITASVHVDGEPNPLALSDDGQYLYVGLDAGSKVQRFTLNPLALDLTIPLAADPIYGAMTAVDIEVAPGAPRTIAVSLGAKYWAPYALGGAVIYDDDVPRPTQTKDSADGIYDSLQWGADATVLFGGEGETTGKRFYVLSVGAAGVTQTQVCWGGIDSTLLESRLLGIYSDRIHFDASTGLIYSESGTVLAPGSGEPVGMFQTCGPMAIDGNQNLAFSLAQDLDEHYHVTQYAIRSNNLTEFTPIGVVAIPNSPLIQTNELPRRLLRWGTQGLVFGGSGIPLYILSGPFMTGAVSSPTVTTPTVASISPLSAVAGGPALTLDVKGIGFKDGSLVQWNGESRSTTFLSETHLQASITAQDVAATGTAQVTVANGSGNGAISGGATFTLADFQTLVVDLPANDIIWDSWRKVIYASVPSTAGTKGNSIAVIDPVTGSILSSMFAGSEPDRLALSDDGQFLYVGFTGAPVVQRYILPSLTLDATVSLGVEFGSGPTTALDIKVAPGAPHTMAVVLGNLRVEPYEQGNVAIFDDATARTKTAPGYGYIIDSVEWASDAAHLYGADVYGSNDYYALTVADNGLELSAYVHNAFTGIHEGIHFDPSTGFIYSDSGQVLAPATGQTVGTFPAVGPMTPDSTQGLAFFLSNQKNGSAALQSYTLTQFKSVHSVQLGLAPSSVSQANLSRLFRWGSNGLAMGGKGNLIYLVTGPFVLGD